MAPRGLCGRGGVTLAPPAGAQYYLTEDDVGKRSRAAASRRHLARLNPYVGVDIHEGPITEGVVARHHVRSRIPNPR